MTAPDFVPWPKIARLNRDMVITEKIDGTNACVVVTDEGDAYAQSRTRSITPDADNYGFARWVWDNAGGLAHDLGPGYHFGEWWGAGIQRRYGLTEKRLSLFNVARWEGAEFVTPQLEVVPVLHRGPFDNGAVDIALQLLARNGSAAAPGFDRPEGVVVWHEAARTSFKVLIEGDDVPKGAAA